MRMKRHRAHISSQRVHDRGSKVGTDDRYRPWRYLEPLRTSTKKEGKKKEKEKKARSLTVGASNQPSGVYSASSISTDRDAMGRSEFIPSGSVSRTDLGHEVMGDVRDLRAISHLSSQDDAVDAESGHVTPA